MYWSEFFGKLSNSNYILLALPEFVDLDTIVALSAISNYLKSKNIEFDIAFSGDQSINTRYGKILELAGVDPGKFIGSVDPVYYNFLIPNVSDDVSLTWQKKEGGLQIRIVSEKTPINFDSLKSYRDGGLYDFVLLINCGSVNDLGAIFARNPARFLKFDLFVLSNGFNADGHDYKFHVIEMEGESSISSFILKKFEESNVYLDDKYLRLACISLVWEVYVSKKLSKLSSYSYLLSRLNANGVDLDDILQEYFSDNLLLTRQNAKLVELIVKGLKFDEGRKIVYSVVSSKDMMNVGVDKSTLYSFLESGISMILNYKYLFIIVDDGSHCDVLMRNIGSDDFGSVKAKLGAVGGSGYAVARTNKDVYGALNSVLQLFGGAVNVDSRESPYGGYSSNIDSAVSSNVVQDSGNHDASTIPTTTIGQSGNEAQQQHTDENTQQSINVDTTVYVSPFQKASEDLIRQAIDDSANAQSTGGTAGGASPFVKAW